MPFIEMSSGFAANISTRMIRLGDVGVDQLTGSIATGGLLTRIGGGQSNAPLGILTLMKGVQPTAGSFLTSYSQRSADILCIFNSYNTLMSSSNNFQTTNQSTNPANISTEYVAASATGICTWFWLAVVQASFGPIVTSATPYQQIIGSVGTTGSGADLIIPTTTITSGEQYRVLNLRLQFPTSWTY